MKWSRSAARFALRRRAVTLIELLVVVTLLLLVTAATVPLLVDQAESRRTREAARMVSTYFAVARARAAETGRPVGVMIERSAGEQQVAIVLSTAEVPEPYSGDTVASRIVTTGNGLMKFITNDAGWIGLVRLGDQVKINYQGGLARIAVGTADPQGYLAANSLPWLLTAEFGTLRSSPAGGVPFQVFRQPVKSAVTPVQLPEPMVIDLSASGFVGSEFAALDGGPVTVMFSPQGNVERVYYAGSFRRPVEPLYLLVGKRDQVSSGSLTGIANWQDPTTLWVTINAQTGQVSTAENATLAAGVVDPSSGIPLARQLAQTAQSMGGR